VKSMFRQQSLTIYIGLAEDPQFLNAIGDDDESISLENLGPRNGETKIEEKLEELLKPEAKSITLKIHAGRGKAGGKMKVNVRDMLVRYEYFYFARCNLSNTFQRQLQSPTIHHH